MFAEFSFFDFRKSSETASKSKLAKSLKSIRPKEQNMLEDGHVVLSSSSPKLSQL